MARPITDQTVNSDTAAAFAATDRRCVFGPSFFLGRLSRFVRDQCPDPQEHLPVVHVHLADGEPLDLCHIIGVSPQWVVLAVRDPESHVDGMAIEIVPYEMIRRVCIRTRRGETGAIGFTHARAPEIIPAETLVQAAMTPSSSVGD